VAELEFDRGEFSMPALSPQHYRVNMEATAAPVVRVVATLSGEPERLAKFRAELDDVIEKWFSSNRVRQSFLMTRAVKR
jgi:hypothetical protein